ncbi:MAG: LOG family protein [Proteobacteria bacterium]|nr:LOG family protein [Pseudomonadota bacterium]
MKKAPKAYKNPEFLGSPEARTIRMLAEYLEPESRLKKFNIEDTIVFFGSARTRPPAEAQQKLAGIRQQLQAGTADSPELAAQLRRAEMDVRTSGYYEDSVRLAGMLTTWSKELRNKKQCRNRRFIICSGGGPGIMEAANRGASEAGGYSIGMNISLPYEQEPNPYISRELMFEFHYFFVRKFWLAYMAKALIIFPGGFGTLDEMLELLTLLQTGKITKRMPIIIYGSQYWKEVLNFDAMVKWGMISPEDLGLFSFCDTPEDAFQYLKTALAPLCNDMPPQEQP